MVVDSDVLLVLNGVAEGPGECTEGSDCGSSVHEVVKVGSSCSLFFFNSGGKSDG